MCGRPPRLRATGSGRGGRQGVREKEGGRVEKERENGRGEGKVLYGCTWWKNFIMSMWMLRDESER